MRGVNKSRAKGSRTEKRDYPSPHSEALINWGRSRCQPSSDRAAGLSCSGAQHSIHWLFRNCVETESRAEPLIRSVRSHGQPLFCISPRCVPHFVAWLFDITLCYGLCEMRAPEHIQRPQVLWQVAVNHFAKLLLLRTDLWLLVDSAKNLLLQPRHVVHAVGSIYTCALVGLCVPVCIYFFYIQIDVGGKFFPRTWSHLASLCGALIRSNTSTEICVNRLVQFLLKLVQRNKKEICMRKSIDDEAVLAVVRGVLGAWSLHWCYWGINSTQVHLLGLKYGL